MIQDVKTGRFVAVRILPVEADDLRSLRGWRFKWVAEARKSEVFKLVPADNPALTLGLMSIDRQQGFIEVKLLESSASNVGRVKSFRGIAGNLLAFAADQSIRRGDDGYVRLTAKTELIDHYIREYRFDRIGHSQNLILLPAAATWLIDTFFRRPDDETAT